MNKKTKAALENIRTLIADKRTEYKDTKGMEGYISFLDQTWVNILLRLKTDDVYFEWLEGIRSDIKLQEYINRAEAGLLTPEEAEARRRLLEFFMSKPDLPDYVK